MGGQEVIATFLAGLIRIEIELRNQRDGSGKFSISIAQHDMLRTLDGYDDSGD